MTSLLKKDTYKWNPEATSAFEELKMAMPNTLVFGTSKL